MSLILRFSGLIFCYTIFMQRRSYIAVLLAASLIPVAASAQRGFGGGGRVSMSAPSRGPVFAPRPGPAFSPHAAGSFGPRFVGQRFVGPPQGRALAGSRVFVPNR